MTPAARLAREDTITEALRVANDAIGDDVPTAQALRIIAALKRMRSDKPVRVIGGTGIDYLSRVQELARAAWLKTHSTDSIGPEHDAAAGIDTPIGRLRMTTWRQVWESKRRGRRIAWAGEYSLDDEPITIAEIRAMGLAQRPTTRLRKKRL